MKLLVDRHHSCFLTGAAILLLSGTATTAAAAHLAADTQIAETASLEGTRPRASRSSRAVR